MAGFAIEPKLRPCMVKGERKALFHMWSNFSNVIEPSPLKGGHPGGTIAGTLGIVEYEDGTVDKVEPYDICFVDGSFDEYASPEKKEPDVTAKWIIEYDAMFGSTRLTCSNCGHVVGFRGHINPETYPIPNTCKKCNSKMVIDT